MNMDLDKIDSFWSIVLTLIWINIVETILWFLVYVDDAFYHVSKLYLSRQENGQLSVTQFSFTGSQAQNSRTQLHMTSLIGPSIM